MFKATHFGIAFRTPQVRSCLCLVLAISFLFNPFLAVASSSFGTSVTHLPSFRATVASSELLKFTPQEKNADLSEAENQLPQKFATVAPAVGLFAFIGVTQVLPVAQNVLLGTIWFRPPPAV